MTINVANRGKRRAAKGHTYTEKNASYNREASFVDYLDYLAPLYCFNDFVSVCFYLLPVIL